MNTTTEPGTALALPEPTALKDLFRKPEGIDSILARIKADALSQAKALDPANKKDRAALTSLAFKVAQSKTALDAAGKDLNEERRKIIDAVDAQRRVIRDTLDKVRDEIKAPVLKWEADEAARVAAIRARLDASFKSPVAATTSRDLIAVRDVVAAVPMDASWAEFLGEAEIAKMQRIEALDRAIDAAIEREEQAAELERLRAEAAKQAEADRLARLAAEAEAAERQRAADEAAAQARAAQEAAEEAQRKAEADAADLRRQLVAAQEKAAREAAEAEEKAAQAKLIKEARIAREAEKARQDKIDAELKAQAEKKAILDAEARAQALIDHRAAIRAAIIASLAAMSGRATPEAIADALIGGAIPHCKVVL